MEAEEQRYQRLEDGTRIGFEPDGFSLLAPELDEGALGRGQVVPEVKLERDIGSGFVEAPVHVETTEERNNTASCQAPLD